MVYSDEHFWKTQAALEYLNNNFKSLNKFFFPNSTHKLPKAKKLFTGPNGKSQSEKRLGKQKRKSKLKKQIQNTATNEIWAGS